MAREKIWIPILILTNIITVILLIAVSFRYGVPQKLLDRLEIISLPIAYDYKTEIYINRITEFSKLKNGNIKIVMLGDSITAGIDWNELLNRTDVSNQGIGEDTTEGFLNRLEYIYKINPEICFIMGGVNDLGKNIPIGTIMQNIKTIAKTLTDHNITVIIQSTLYVSTEWPFWKKRNKDINKLNEELKKYCNEEGLIYMDINESVSENNILKGEYTNDGVHLLRNGYEAWKGKIISVLNN
jgi:lysophospholipase L1-like esterase